MAEAKKVKKTFIFLAILFSLLVFSIWLVLFSKDITGMGSSLKKDLNKIKSSHFLQDLKK